MYVNNEGMHISNSMNWAANRVRKISLAVILICEFSILNRSNVHDNACLTAFDFFFSNFQNEWFNNQHFTVSIEVVCVGVRALLLLFILNGFQFDDWTSYNGISRMCFLLFSFSLFFFVWHECNFGAGKIHTYTHTQTLTLTRARKKAKKKMKSTD